MPRRRRRRRFHFLLGACAGACIVLAAIVGAWALGLGPFAPVIGVPAAFADRITVGEDGGFTYLFPEEDIAYDADEHALYADDTLIAYLEPGVGARERLALADRVGGTVVGNLEGGIDLVQIHVGDASFADLIAMAEELSSSEGVIMALVEGPLLRQADAGADPNGWGDGGSIENDPSGNNWWAEAIGAYRAWEHADRFSPVAVGVIDDGFDLDHPDLDGAATLLSSHSGNGASDHGTAVASIIGALDNGEGLRGVAAGDDGASPTLVCADYTSAEYASKGSDAAVLRALVQEDMPGQGGIAVNCSYGVPPTSTFDAWDQDGRREALIRHARDTSEAYLAAIVCLMLDARQADPDGAARDFLFVQSAGNGLVDGAPLGAYANGYFAGIDEALFVECFPEGEVAGISFGDVHAHTLVVGAARERTEGEVALQGDEWRLCETSCFGEPWVDLCAPGPHKGVYAACVDGYGPFGDTSAAAPMATGSAALLWSLDPSLAAAEVRSLLVHSGDGIARGGEEQGGVYPMLDIGAAADEAVAQVDRAGAFACEVVVVDEATGLPVEGAQATFSLADEGTEMSVETDADGYAGVSADDMVSFDVTVRADGYDELREHLVAVALDEDADPLERAVRLELAPDDGGASAALRACLEGLVEQYGIVDTGSERYEQPGIYGGGWTLVEATRLTGLLSADIRDFDGDGALEMLTVRLDPGAGWTVRKGGAWNEVRLVLSVYEAAGEGAELADELAAVVPGLPDEHPIQGVHVALLDGNGAPTVLVDHCGNFNDTWFGTVGLSYDGSGLRLAGGVNCFEHYNAIVCMEAEGVEALGSLVRSTPLEAGSWTGWGQVLDERWGDGASVSADTLSRYQDAYDGALAGMGVEDDAMRSTFLEEVGSAYDDAMGTVALRCTLRPSEHLAGTGGGEVVDLCGAASTMDAGEVNALELLVYDEAGLLDAYR